MPQNPQASECSIQYLGKANDAHGVAKKNYVDDLIY